MVCTQKKSPFQQEKPHEKFQIFFLSFFRIIYRYRKQERRIKCRISIVIA